jgi:hypothetical protein
MRMHPDIYLPKGEVEYFEDPVYGTRGASYLDELFANAPPARVYGFKRPELLARPECPPRIEAELPDVRLVAVLRAPVSRTVSAYYHYAQGRAIPLLPLNEGLREILDGDLDERFPLARSVIEYSLYGEQLTRYRRFFGAGAMLVLFDHELTGDTGATMRRVFDFLGVDPEGLVVDPPGNRSNVGAYSIPRLRFLRLVSPLGYAYRRGSPFGRVRRSPVALAAYKTALRLDRVVLARVLRNEEPHLDEDVFHRLRGLFREDAKMLEQFTGPVPRQWGLS